MQEEPTLCVLNLLVCLGIKSCAFSQIPTDSFHVAGHIGYALAPLIARGLMCGPDQQVILHMHDREEAAQNLAAVQMELDDLASDLLLSERPFHNTTTSALRYMMMEIHGTIP